MFEAALYTFAAIGFMAVAGIIYLIVALILGERRDDRRRR